MLSMIILKTGHRSQNVSPMKPQIFPSRVEQHSVEVVYRITLITATSSNWVINSAGALHYQPTGLKHTSDLY